MEVRKSRTPPTRKLVERIDITVPRQRIHTRGGTGFRAVPWRPGERDCPRLKSAALRHTVNATGERVARSERMRMRTRTEPRTRSQPGGCAHAPDVAPTPGRARQQHCVLRAFICCFRGYNFGSRKVQARVARPIFAEFDSLVAPHIAASSLSVSLEARNMASDSTLQGGGPRRSPVVPLCGVCKASAPCRSHLPADSPALTRASASPCTPASAPPAAERDPLDPRQVRRVRRASQRPAAAAERRRLRRHEPVPLVPGDGARGPRARAEALALAPLPRRRQPREHAPL